MLLSLFSNITYYLLLVIPYFSINELFTARNNPEMLPFLKKYQAQLATSKALMLLLSPYRTAGKTRIYDKSIIEKNVVPTEMQWCRRFQRWVKFINANCPKLSCVNLCLSKADLFCDVNAQAQIIENKMGLARSYYVQEEFFPTVNPLFQQSLQTLKTDSVRFFIVSIHSRTLLEFPWLSLATDL
jgi:hypothetical protein